jgi:GTPase Era involved in 16S rRNA processing
MEKIDKLINIAEFLELDKINEELKKIKARSEQENANLILPLIGEFSSGKTTLINSLTDSKKLETATEPTTATIYEVHFGCDSCSATVLTENNETYQVKDIADLKNDALSDAKVVTVFDTSKRVPKTTILVDTPGLSSSDPKHKQTLIDFLPEADGILLVTDINQQITRSLTDFIETMKLSRKTIFLVLTKSDTKSQSDVEAAKKYISENCKIPLKQVAVVSASKNYLNEIYDLLDYIQKSKNEILKQVDGQRLISMENILIAHIDELMKASSSDKELDDAIRKQQCELNKISLNIDSLVESMSDDIDEKGRNTVRQFEDIILSKLNSVVIGNSTNIDNEAISVINNTVSLLMNDYKKDIQGIFREKAKNQKVADNEISLVSLIDLSMDEIQMSGLSYNLDLSTMGHEYDGWIKMGVIAAVAAAAVATAGALAAAGGGAITASALAESAAGTATVGTVIEAADVASDVVNITSNANAVRRIKKAALFISKTTEKYDQISRTNQQISQQVGSDKGMLESLVGYVTDKTISKPQRMHAIRNYIDSSLSPEFRKRMNQISDQLVESIRLSLQKEATAMIQQKTETLSQLKFELGNKKDLFDQRMSKLRECKTNLLTI